MPEVFASVPQFLSVVEEKGPARPAQVAHGLRRESSDSWSYLLNACWPATGEPPSDPEEFLAFAFLQPYAEFERSHAHLQLDGYTHALCPFCNRKPGLGVLRQQGDGGP